MDTALSIVSAIESGNFTLGNLLIAAQTTDGSVINDITGVPNPTMTVLGQLFDIGSLLGNTVVDSFAGNRSTTHFREYFETVGETPPDGYDEDWNVTNEAPTDIHWNAADHTNDITLPGEMGSGVYASTVIANLSTTDPDNESGFTYSLLDGSSAGFTVSAAGVVTATSGLVNNTPYTLNVQVTDANGASHTETFNITTGNNVVAGEAINGTAGNDVIYADEGADVIDAGAGDDTVFGMHGTDQLFGGDGNDVLDGGFNDDLLEGGAGSDILRGDNGIDTLRGGDGNDVLDGGTGDDFAINGGAGDDILTGGDGSDRFSFATDLATAGIDKITDFSPNAVGNNDRINMDNAVFTGLGATQNVTLSAAAFAQNTTGLAGDDSDRVIYNSDTGALFYDADGLGGADAVQFAELQIGLSLTNSDFFII